MKTVVDWIWARSLRFLIILNLPVENNNIVRVSKHDHLLFTHQNFIAKQMMYLHIENRQGNIICKKNISIQNMTHHH